MPAEARRGADRAASQAFPSGGPTRRPAASSRVRAALIAAIRAGLAGVAVAGVAGLLSLSPVTSRYAADFAIVGMGAVACWLAVGALAGSLEPRRRTALDAMRDASSAEPDGVASLDRIEWALLDVKWERASAATSIAELLGPIARTRLIERRHVDPLLDPAAARDILGADGWELLQARRATPLATDAAQPTTQPANARPVTKERLAHLIETLEEL